jgi:hypothetical protein
LEESEEDDGEIAGSALEGYTVGLHELDFEEKPGALE